MKPSILAWATCILLLLGQILFFYMIVFPQWQSQQVCQTQYVARIPDAKQAPDWLAGFVKNGKTHIDQVVVAPSTNGDPTLVVIYHTVGSCH